MKEECKKGYERLSEYLDGELDDEACRDIEQHFRHCPECRECLDSMEKTIRLCREMGTEQIPADARGRLRSMLKECIDRTSG